MQSSPRPSYYHFDTVRKSDLWVFDFDGTLVDSMAFTISNITSTLKKFSVDVHQELFERIRSNHPERLLEGVLSDSEIPIAQAEMKEYFLANWASTRVFPGIFEVLNSLKAAGKSLAVWTGRDMTTTRFLLEKHKLENYFGWVVSGSCVERNKPSGDGLQKVLTDSGVDSAKVFHVGDHWHDLHGAKSLGVQAILATWQSPPSFEIPWEDVLHFSETLKLQKWIETIYP